MQEKGKLVDRLLTFNGYVSDVLLGHPLYYFAFLLLLLVYRPVENQSYASNTHLLLTTWHTRHIPLKSKLRFWPKIHTVWPTKSKLVMFFHLHTIRNLHFLSKNSTLISRIIVDFLGEKLVKMLGFCQNWIFGQKCDFSNSVTLQFKIS